MVLCQLLLLGFVAKEAFYEEEMILGFIRPAESWSVVLARFVCAIMLHINLTSEIKQGFRFMKFALSHPYKFKDWTKAYIIGLTQTLVVIAVETINFAVMSTDHTIMNIIMNFLALVVIT